MPHRHEHQAEVQRYLQKSFRIQDWSFSLPHGSGMETYIAKGNGQAYFVKVGAPIERYLAMAEIELTPPVIAHGRLERGVSVIVHPFIKGQRPLTKDFCDQLKKVALLIHKMHHHPQIQNILQRADSTHYKDAGLLALNRLHNKWGKYKSLVPTVADFVDGKLEYLAEQIRMFAGQGLVASHNDICNANWLFASDGKVYVVDFDSMSMDDPAADIGALLWWYYPPELRGQFLEFVGYRYDDEEFRFRMRIRMAMHCLSIILPREGSFDQFKPENFSESLRDFRAVLDGKENPEGYLK